MPPAARITDMHICPMVTGIVPHVGGPILPPGVPTVLIDMLPAARMMDPTVHGGMIMMGSPTCIIGEIGIPSPGMGGLGGIVSGMVASGLGGALSAM